MGLCNVSFEGVKLFKWEGDEAKIANIEAAVGRLAERGKVSVEVLIQSVVLGIAEKGHFLTANSESEMMSVICFLLSRPTQHPDHPGTYRDYVPLWDFDFDIHLDPAERTFNVNATGGFHAVGRA